VSVYAWQSFTSDIIVVRIFYVAKWRKRSGSLYTIMYDSSIFSYHLRSKQFFVVVVIIGSLLFMVSDSNP